MQIDQFKSVVATFIDPNTDMLIEGNRICLSVNDSIIDATASMRQGEIFIEEGGVTESAFDWIVNRLARLDLLANRLEEQTPRLDEFITPSAMFLPTLEKSAKSEGDRVADALASVQESMIARSPLETTVLYLTSDAGEGKTTLINELARSQARLFKQRKTDWLLVPIPLGGRHFLRFDDITIGALQNRYRFSFLYYNSFLALVRMGAIVPAFDGFEEMFVENSSGEALSAMGILVDSLQSKGAIVVAARKAYFEFENLRTKERLFDSIRENSVGFSKIELIRWEVQQFLDYCLLRGIEGGQEIYNRVSQRIGADHALLTRAVLVKRLLDVAVDSDSLDSLLDKISGAGHDFFRVFVLNLIEREAHEKWLDRSGDSEVAAKLLDVDEHLQLLSQIALTMWEERVDFIRLDTLEFVTEYFCEIRQKNAFQAHQVKERIRGHALLVQSANAIKAVEFDHEQFRYFFLGEGIGHLLQSLDERAIADILAVFRRGVLPVNSQRALVRFIKRAGSLDVVRFASFFIKIGSIDSQASYAHQNASSVLVRILNRESGGGLVVNGLALNVNALERRELNSIEFRDCFFSATSLAECKLRRVSFVRCKFAQLEIHGSTVFEDVVLDDSRVETLLLNDEAREIWNPEEIAVVLGRIGVAIKSASESIVGEDVVGSESEDDAIRDIRKVVRYFMRSTHISESVLQIKLGVAAHPFLDDVLPRLLRAGILVEVPNVGSGIQRRFKLGISLALLNNAIAECRGSLDKLLDSVQEYIN